MFWRLRFGVRARLLSAFGLMLALILGVAGIGWLGFGEARATLERLQRDSLTEVEQALRLAEASASLVAQAPRVANAAVLFTLDDESMRLRERLDAFLALSGEVATTLGADGRLHELAEGLARTLTELGELTRTNLFLTARLRDLRYRLAELDAALAMPGEGGAAARLGVALLVEATSADGEDALAGLRARLTAALARPEAPGGGMAPDARAELAAITEGEHGVFALRSRQLDNADRRAYLLALGGVLSAGLNEQVTHIVGAVQAAAERRGAAAAATLDAGRRRIVALALLGFAAAILSALYVLRDLAGNLHGVTEAMRRLAQGDREVRVPATDRPDELGTLARAFQVFRDHAFRLDETTRLLETVFDSINDGLTVFDATGRLLAWNPRVLALYGRADGTLVHGQTIEAAARALGGEGAAHQDLDGQPLAGAALEALRRTPNFRFERRLAGGRFIELRGSPMPDGGLVVVHTDLSERKRAEERLLEAQKMESVGQLTGGMAHDFNNLLAAIIGNANLLLDGLDEGSAAHRRAARVLDAAERGATITQRLLAFARKQALQPQTVDANALIEGMLDLLGYSVGDAIALETTLAPDPWPVRADAGQLENALMNLVLNSRDAMPGGGRIRIVTRNAPWPALAPRLGTELAVGDYVTIEVADSGCGIGPEVRARVFEPFYTTKGPGAGTGLGLSMVYGFIKQSGGHVELDSTPGVGTTLRLYLPCAAGAPAAARAQGAAPSAGLAATVLVVEDEPLLRQTVADLLGGFGYRALVAADATEALALLAREPVGLLFSDVMLPGALDGPRLARAARERSPGLPVIFTSALSRDALAARGHALPEADALLPKPYPPEALATAIARTLARVSPA